MTARPDVLLYDADTMNGWKPLIFLKEADVAHEANAARFEEQ